MPVIELRFGALLAVTVLAGGLSALGCESNDGAEGPPSGLEGHPACRSGADCSDGLVCGNNMGVEGPYYCLDACAPPPDGPSCAEGFSCSLVNSADCPGCRVDVFACWPD